MSSPRPTINYSGLALAALAFGLTRLLVAGTLEPDAISFMVAGVVPLLAGLGLALFGVAIAVGAVSQSYARAVWLWSVVGTFAMVVVLSTTAIHSILIGRGMDPLLESGPLVGNALLGGTIAGAVVGDRVARRRRREDDLARYAERATLVNRVLRHEVTNAATVLKGYAQRLDDSNERADCVKSDGSGIRDDSDRHGDSECRDGSEKAGGSPKRDGSGTADRSEPRDGGEIDDSERREGDTAGSARASDDQTVAVIRDSADRIETTVDRISEFASTDAELTDVEFASVLQEALTEVPTDAAVTAELSIPDGTRVRADRRLPLLVGQLLQQPFDRAGTDTAVELSAVADAHWVTISVSDDGPGLCDRAVELLETPGLPQHDDPRVGYGLQMVRLLVDHYDAELAVESGDETTITVRLPRASQHRAAGLGRGVPMELLSRAGSAAILAGLVMGVAVEALTGRVSTIGTLYGVDSPVVGWVTHLFHSVLFGLVFAAGLQLRYFATISKTVRGRVGLGVAWGVLVWAVGTGLLLPLGLQAANAGTQQLPYLAPVDLLAHVLWGAILGRAYTSVPELGAVGDWLQSRLGTS